MLALYTWNTTTTSSPLPTFFFIFIDGPFESGNRNSNKRILIMINLTLKINHKTCVFYLYVTSNDKSNVSLRTTQYLPWCIIRTVQTTREHWRIISDIFIERIQMWHSTSVIMWMTLSQNEIINLSRLQNWLDLIYNLTKQFFLGKTHVQTLSGFISDWTFSDIWTQIWNQPCSFRKSYPMNCRI